MDYKINTICLASAEKAEECLDKIANLFDLYDCVSVADVYRITGYCQTLEDESYGWISNTDIAAMCYEKNLETMTCTLILPPAKLIREPIPSTIASPIGSARPQSDDPMVSHPSHYQSKTGLEVIDVIEAFTEDLKGIEATDTGNVIKYICRWKDKNGLQDLKKAKWYLEHLIDHVEKETEHHEKV